MTEKFSIVKQLDMCKLDEGINKFRMVKGYDPYIFMNFRTMEEIRNVTERKLNCFIMIINKYKGYKVFEDNDLLFGEIELR